MRNSKSRNRSNKNHNNRSMGSIMNRVFDSSGPEGKVRGTPQQIIDKYAQLARDSQLSGDRVAAENFQQHGEHYSRMLAQAQREMDARREQQERENREKQAQRDAERAERDQRIAAEGGGDDAAEQPDAMDVVGESDAIAVIGDEDTTEVVDAPAEPAAPRRRRAPKPKVVEADADNDAAPTPEAAE